MMLHNINICLTFCLLCAAHVKTILDYEGFVIAVLIYAFAFSPIFSWIFVKTNIRGIIETL